MIGRRCLIFITRGTCLLKGLHGMGGYSIVLFDLWFTVCHSIRRQRAHFVTNSTRTARLEIWNRSAIHWGAAAMSK